MVDKMMRLFIIQAISGFVTRDYDTGLHFLNEVKTHFAQNQSNLNATLRGLAKEIIQSLDMLAPGTSAAQFKEMSFQEGQEIQETQEVYHNPNQELSSILNRRKRRKPKKQEQETAENGKDGLFGGLGKLDLSSVDSKDSTEDPIPNISQMSPKEKFHDQEPEFYDEKPTSITSKLTEEQIEENKILEVLLKRKKQKGELTKEDEEIIKLIEKKKEEEELERNPIEKVRRRRKSRRSQLWDD